MIVSLTSKDGLKENLMKIVDSLKKLSEMERDQILPVINSVLFRRLIDKTGVQNERRFLS